MSEIEPKPPQQDKPENLGDTYNRIYESKEPVFGGGKPLSIVEKIPEFVFSGNALDIGAGEGRHSLFLARQGLEVTAVDLSEKGIEKLTKTAEVENLKIDAAVADIREVKIDKEYSAVVCSFVLHHLPRAEALRMIEGMKAHTENGGLNALAVFTQEGDFFKQNPNTDNFYPTSGELESLYEGWNIIEYSEEQGQALSKNVDGSPKVNVNALLLAQKPTA